MLHFAHFAAPLYKQYVAASCAYILSLRSLSFHFYGDIWDGQYMLGCWHRDTYFDECSRYLPLYLMPVDLFRWYRAYRKNHRAYLFYTRHHNFRAALPPHFSHYLYHLHNIVKFCGLCKSRHALYQSIAIRMILI